MNLKVISRNVGFALLVSALFMLLSILISMGEGNDSALVALAISFIITFTVGIFPLIFVRKAEAISLKDGYMIIVLSWLLSFIFGMLPYVLWGGPFTVDTFYRRFGSCGFPASHYSFIFPGEVAIVQYGIIFAFQRRLPNQSK